MLQRLIHGSFWATSEKMVSVFLGFASYFLLAHLLSPHEMGAYFLTMSLVALSATLAQLGLNQTIVRLVAEAVGTGRPGRAAAAVKKVMLYGGAGALVVAGILISGAGRWVAVEVFHSSLMAHVMVLAGIMLIMTTFQGLLSESFRGFYDIRYASIFSGFFSTLISILLFFILWMKTGHADLATVMILSIIGGTTSNLAAAFLLKRKVNTVAGKDELRRREILTIAWPMLVTNLTLFVLNQMSIWVVGAFLPESQVAVYGAALRFALLLEKPLLIANAFLPPIIAEMYFTGRKTELERIIRTVAAFVSIPALLLLLGFILFGKMMLGIIFGEFYQSGTILLLILSMGQFINVWSGSCGITLMMTGHQKYMMGITVVCGLLGLGASIILVQLYGALGVAISFSATLSTQNILMLVFCRIKTGIWAFAHFSWPAFRRLIKSEPLNEPARP